MNNYEPYFPTKSIFIHGCLHSDAAVLGWLDCAAPALPLWGMDLPCGRPFISGLRGVDGCFELAGSDAPPSHV